MAKEILLVLIICLTANDSLKIKVYGVLKTNFHRFRVVARDDRVKRQKKDTGSDLRYPAVVNPQYLYLF